MGETGAMSQSGWMHVMKVDDGKGKTTIYVNGKRVRAPKERKIAEDLLGARSNGWFEKAGR